MSPARARAAPDSNAIATSNGDSVTIPDWERAADTRTPATNGTLTLGATVVISIQVGADGVASGGLEIQFTCNPPVSPPTTTITSAPEPSTTTTTVDEPPATTTTLSPPPVGGVPAGGGSEAIASVSDVATQLGVALLVIGAVALLGGLWVGRKRRDG